MKKVLSTLVAAIVAVSFAGIVFAQEAPPPPAENPAAPVAGEMKPDVKEHHKRHHRKHHKKHHRKHMKKEEAPAVPAGAVPDAPPAQQ